MKKKRQLTEERKAQMREYSRRNRNKVIESAVKWRKKMMEENPLFKFDQTFRVNFHRSLRAGGWKETSKIRFILGCSYEHFISHIESTWEEGMSWDNFGRNNGCWIIEHTLPTSKSKDLEELISRLHWTNTRAMWTEENIRKGNK